MLARRLESLLDGLVIDAGNHAEPATCKLCVSTLRLLVTEWCGGASEAAALAALPGFHQFVVQRIGVEVAVRTYAQPPSITGATPSELADLIWEPVMVYEGSGTDKACKPS